MKIEKTRFWQGFGSAIILAFLLIFLLPLFLAATGVINVSAQKSWGPIESFLDYASMRSITHHATTQKNPFANDPAAIAVGLSHYKENCLMCHGAPDIKPSELAKGLNPSAPDLSSDDTQEMPDGELYWTISHGIRMTGMPAFEPTHTSDERWKIVTFLRHLSKLTDAEKAKLNAGRDEEEHHHEGKEEEHHHEHQTEAHGVNPHSGQAAH